MSDARAVVRQLIADVLKRKRQDAGLEDIKEGVSLTRQLGIDSLDLLQLAAAVEKRFDVRFEDDEVRAMDDLGSIVRALELKRRGEPA